MGTESKSTTESNAPPSIHDSYSLLHDLAGYDGVKQVVEQLRARHAVEPTSLRDEGLPPDLKDTMTAPSVSVTVTSTATTASAPAKQAPAPANPAPAAIKLFSDSPARQALKMGPKQSVSDMMPPLKVSRRDPAAKQAAQIVKPGDIEEDNVLGAKSVEFDESAEKPDSKLEPEAAFKLWLAGQPEEFVALLKKK